MWPRTPARMRIPMSGDKRHPTICLGTDSNAADTTLVLDKAQQVPAPEFLERTSDPRCDRIFHSLSISLEAYQQVIPHILRPIRRTECCGTGKTKSARRGSSDNTRRTKHLASR